MPIITVDKEKLQQDFDGFELYYDKSYGILYSSLSAIVRWTLANSSTVSNIGSRLNLGELREVYTPQGFRTLRLFTSAEVIQILSALAKSKRVNKKVRENANDRLTLLATLGNELGGMLAVAPEELAKRAIAQTTSVEQLAEIQEYAGNHEAYLREYHGLKDELTSRGAKGIHHATVNKHNNELVGVPNGGRPYMSEDEKDTMTLIQLSEKMVLKKTSTANPWQAVNKCKQVGDDFIKFITGYDSPKLAQ